MNNDDKHSDIIYNDYLPQSKVEDLLKLSSTTEINVFNKRKNKWILRDTRIIVNECNKLKKKKVKNLSTNLKNIYSKKDNCNPNCMNELKNINDKTISDIDTLDNIIKMVNATNFDHFIEIYSN